MGGLAGVGRREKDEARARKAKTDNNKWTQLRRYAVSKVYTLISPFETPAHIICETINPVLFVTSVFWRTSP